MMSVSAGFEPRYGTWVIFAPVISMNNSPDMMHRRAVAGRRHVDLARVGFDVVDELLDGLRRHVVVDHHHVRHAHEAADRRDVADEVERQLLVERRVDAVRRIDQQHGVAVGRRREHGFDREVVAGAGLVLDDELLAGLLRQVLPDQARQDVGGAARHVADEPVDRLGRIVGAPNAGSARSGSGDQAQRRQTQENHDASSLHFSPYRGAAMAAVVLFVQGRKVRGGPGSAQAKQAVERTLWASFETIAS